MATYCTDAQLTRWLPESLPANFDTAGERLPYITSASSLVDGKVGPRFALLASFQKFPDVTDTPATPAVIQLCASWLAAYLLLVAMKAVNLTARGDPKPWYDAADRELTAIKSGQIHVFNSAGTEYGTTNVSMSTTDDFEPSFTMGGYDASGNLISDDAGTLDGLTT